MSSRIAFVVAVVLIAACDSKRAARDKPAPDVRGRFSIDGEQLSPLACRPKHGPRSYVEVVTPKGVLRFEDKQLFWTEDAARVERGSELTCSRLDRSWGGGVRPDGSAYWRGTLSFECKAGITTYDGDLDLDCGNITIDERRSLDAQRDKMRGDQRAGSGSAAGSAAP